MFGPRLGVMPMDFQLDCSDALNVVARQQYVCGSFGVECDPCDALQSAIVVRDIDTCRDLFMDRMDASCGHASGWFIGAHDTRLDVNDEGNLELRSLWEISCSIPAAIEFFLLPTGWQVMLKDLPVVLRKNETATPQPGSYFAAKYGG